MSDRSDGTATGRELKCSALGAMRALLARRPTMPTTLPTGIESHPRPATAQRLGWAPKATATISQLPWFGRQAVAVRYRMTAFIRRVLTRRPNTYAPWRSPPHCGRAPACRLFSRLGNRLVAAHSGSVASTDGEAQNVPARAVTLLGSRRPHLV
jgi:hypothetical protein